MSRYFFHVYDGAQHFDTIGVPCADAHAARRHMLIVAVSQLLGPNARPIQHWSIEAHDNRGEIVGVLELGDGMY